MAYVSYPFVGEDFDDVLTAALERIAVSLPGWTPRETHVEYAVLSEMARLVLDTRTLAADVADSIFRTYGTKLIGLPPQDGTPATGTAVFTLTGTTVQTVPAGTQVLWPAAGTPVLFATVTDISNVAGSLTTAPVQIAAVENGTAANGLAATTLELVDSLSYVASVAATTASSGGTDAETDAEYLDRLTDSLRLLRRIPVLAADFAVLARDTPGVYRALALDNYNPADGTFTNERMIGIAPVDEFGQPVPADVLAALDLRLENEREANFVINVFAPTYTTLTVTFTGEADLNADPVGVRDAAIARIKDYLSPATWAGGDERPPVWRTGENLVGYLDLAGVIKGTPGLLHLTDVTLNGARVNVTLAGAAPLPAANPTVSGTVGAYTP